MKKPEEITIPAAIRELDKLARQFGSDCPPTPEEVNVALENLLLEQEKKLLASRKDCVILSLKGALKKATEVIRKQKLQIVGLQNRIQKLETRIAGAPIQSSSPKSKVNKAISRMYRHHQST